VSVAFSAHTPRYTTVRELLSALERLATGLQKGYNTLDSQLFQNVPQLLEGIEDAAVRLHDLVFPYQPLRLGHHAAGDANKQQVSVRSSSSSWGGTMADAAVDPNPGKVLSPVLTHPSLAEAMRALERMIVEVAAVVNRLMEQQNNHLKIMSQSRKELELQRGVMAMFFMEPEKLVQQVEMLREEVEALAVAGN
jgi:hypothetical protein